ncbi:hypothetical protein J6590_053873 [Homalodisca vitripennis]|nr:hypothetical protein J6590_053873 [Homalodisca vitripennis]
MYELFLKYPAERVRVQSLAQEEGLKRQDELRIFEAEKAMKDIEKKQKKSEKQ